MEGLKEELDYLINLAADLKIQKTNGSLDDETYDSKIDVIYKRMKDINDIILLRLVGENKKKIVNRANVFGKGGKRKLRKTKRMLKKYKPRKHKTRRSNH